MSSRKRQHLGRRAEQLGGMFSERSASFEHSVLATIAYADAAGMPMTAQHVHRLLVQPTRVGERGVPALGTIVSALDELSGRGDVRCVDGWYLSAGSSRDRVEQHLQRLNVQATKWRAMRSRAAWFQALPFVRAICVAGSLAQGKTGPDSDWDMFVIARRRRLYTARTGLLATAWLMRRLRVKRERVAPDKFCFNHYVTDDGLMLRHRSLFVAHALALLVPIHDPTQLVAKFWQANRWCGDYLTHWPPEYPQPIARSVDRSHVLSGIRWMAERVLSTPLGTVLEWALRTWQQGRIAREPMTHAKGGRITADLRELEFHPRSAERAVLARYNTALTSLGIPANEQDSGLQ